MKINESGDYYVIEDEDYIEDLETGGKMLFLVDQDAKLVFRSMMEDDIKQAVKIFYRLTSSEKRQTMRALSEDISKPGSENYFFVLEKIIGSESDNLYENERKIIGFGARKEGIKERKINLKVPDRQGAPQEAVEKLVQRACDYYGMKDIQITTKK